MKHTEQYNWSFSRVNSKGEAKFKHKTDESLDEVLDYLEDRGLDYEVVDKATMIWVYANDTKYSYYYTTGRWAKYSNLWPPSMH